MVFVHCGQGLRRCHMGKRDVRAFFDQREGHDSRLGKTKEVPRLMQVPIG